MGMFGAVGFAMRDWPEIEDCFDRGVVAWKKGEVAFGAIMAFVRAAEALIESWNQYNDPKPVTPTEPDPRPAPVNVAPAPDSDDDNDQPPESDEQPVEPAPAPAPMTHRQLTDEQTKQLRDLLHSVPWANELPINQPQA